MKTLLITGGHPTPALAVIDYIKKHTLPYHLLFVGRKYNNPRERSMSFEYQEIKRMGVPFIHLVTGRMTRLVSLKIFVDMLRIPIGFIHAFIILFTKSPDAVLSFGGYIAAPIAFSASILHIPVYTHEQTIHPGSANIFIGKRAKRIFVSFEESRQFFPNEKVVVTGNPVRSAIFESHQNKRYFHNTHPTLYVTGRSLGSHAINKDIETLLPELTKHFNVIHQTGNIREFNDYGRLKKAKNNLPPDQQKRYIVQEHFFAAEIGSVYTQADMVVSRAGANTLFEWFVLGKPAILIPLPWSAHDEQRKHALLFAKYKVGRVFEQQRPSHELFEMITEMMENRKTYENHFKAVPAIFTQKPDRAIQHILQEIEN